MHDKSRLTHHELCLDTRVYTLREVKQHSWRLPVQYIASSLCHTQLLLCLLLQTLEVTRIAKPLTAVKIKCLVRLDFNPGKPLQMAVVLPE